MAITYYVALPFLRTEEGVVAGVAQEMSSDSANVGALAFRRSGDPNVGNFNDATILKTFGEVPENLDEL
jgi:hypothetical protein